MRDTQKKALLPREGIMSIRNSTQFPINLATIANGLDLATKRLYNPVGVYCCMFAASDCVLPPLEGVSECAPGDTNGTANPVNGLGMLIQTIPITGTSPLMCIHRVRKRDNRPDSILPDFITENMLYSRLTSRQLHSSIAPELKRSSTRRSA